MAPTPNNAQKIKIARPAGVTGAKSPYPIVVKAMKPVEDTVSKAVIIWYTRRKSSQKYIAEPYVQFSVSEKMAEPTVQNIKNTAQANAS